MHFFTQIFELILRKDFLQCKYSPVLKCCISADEKDRDSIFTTIWKPGFITAISLLTWRQPGLTCQLGRVNPSTNKFLLVGCLTRPDIVHFRSACRGTEIFLRELTLLNTLSSNPKSSRSVDPISFPEPAILGKEREALG